ncbi:MAG: UDP-N-acetylglucosamine 2-epimerase (non-hydrolyzing) [Vicinamibacteria bacterium]|nr:UDP-N-acetylglucosamine 2-epimerase (non-hydrolyzing) [Vicinamibacteria bacterium]
MRRLLFIVGTRPEAIKMAPVIREACRRRSTRPIDVRVCATAQHRELLDRALDTFEITADHDLDVMLDQQNPQNVLAGIATRLTPILLANRPDWVVVQGDTTTTMASAVTAFYSGMPVAHVEAGLRTGDLGHPFPEEGNRRLVTAIARLHFAPTNVARANLLREGVDPARVLVVGNPVIDALSWALDQPCDLAALGLQALVDDPARRLLLVTAHRRESFGPPLESIADALNRISAIYGRNILIVFPVHPNPDVRTIVESRLGSRDNILLLPPMDYIPLAHLLRRAHLVLTDSGGLQEEAPALGKPVLVLRKMTERPEVVELGAARVVGTDQALIISETCGLLDDAAAYSRMARPVRPFGDGHAAERIVGALIGENMAAFEPDNSPEITDAV